MFTMVSCGKDVDAKMDKIDLARLLNDEEISEALEKVNENFDEKLTAIEVNAAVLDTDLVDKKTEANGTAKYTIKGDEYAESHTEMTTKVTNSFYTYTNKAVEDGKYAAFGKYYLRYRESYNDGQKDNKEQNLGYSSKGEYSISDIIMGLPFGSSDINQATIGVDRKNNIYAVYSTENIVTSEGHDKDGKDATFKDKTTYEINIKFGNLKDPRIESYKLVNKHEANYDKELKMYSNYQTLSSQVVSYKYEYKSRGNDSGKDNFIDFLPEKSIQNVELGMVGYQKLGNEYIHYGTTNLYPDSTKKDFSSGSLTAKVNNVEFRKDMAYTFVNSYYLMTLDKKNEEIILGTKYDETLSLAESASLDIVNVPNPDGAGTVKGYQLKSGLTSTKLNLQFVSNGVTLNVSVF